MGLDLDRSAGVRRGLLRDGPGVDVLQPEKPGAAPVLLEALLRRRREAVRDFGSRRRTGRACRSGLPPLSGGQLRLVKAWLAQGAPE